MMNAQNHDTALSTTSSTADNCRKDSFSQALLLWVASFPLLAAGLALTSGPLHTFGLVLLLTAAVCFLSPATLLLGCATDSL